MQHFLVTTDIWVSNSNSQMSVCLIAPSHSHGDQIFPFASFPVCYFLFALCHGVRRMGTAAGQLAKMEKTAVGLRGGCCGKKGVTVLPALQSRPNLTRTKFSPSSSSPPSSSPWLRVDGCEPRAHVQLCFKSSGRKVGARSFAFSSVAVGGSFFWCFCRKVLRRFLPRCPPGHVNPFRSLDPRSDLKAERQRINVAAWLRFCSRSLMPERLKEETLSSCTSPAWGLDPPSSRSPPVPNVMPADADEFFTGGFRCCRVILSIVPPTPLTSLTHTHTQWKVFHVCYKGLLCCSKHTQSIFL